MPPLRETRRNPMTDAAGYLLTIFLIILIGFLIIVRCCANGKAEHQKKLVKNNIDKTYKNNYLETLNRTLKENTVTDFKWDDEGRLWILISHQPKYSSENN